jgi:hypothetical protein
LLAGAIGSPQLLQLSGVGDPAHLAQVGVAPLVELPQAGLEKTWVYKKNQPSGCLGFLFFFGFLYICPEERVFRVFTVSRILLGASRL